MAFRLHNTLSTQNSPYFVAAHPTPHSLACLRIDVLVTAAAARLATGVGGLALHRTGFAPVGRRTEFHDVTASSLPSDQPCLVALCTKAHVAQKSIFDVGCVSHKLRHPRPVGLGADAGDLNTPAGEMNQDQHREPGQAAWRPDLDSEEVGGGKDVPVGGEKLPPGPALRASSLGSQCVFAAGDTFLTDTPSSYQFATHRSSN